MSFLLAEIASEFMNMQSVQARLVRHIRKTFRVSSGVEFVGSLGPLRISGWFLVVLHFENHCS